MRQPARAHLPPRDRRRRFAPASSTTSTSSVPGSRRSRLLEATADARELLRRVDVDQARRRAAQRRAAPPRRRSRRVTVGRKSRIAWRPSRSAASTAGRQRSAYTACSGSTSPSQRGTTASAVPIRATRRRITSGSRPGMSQAATNTWGYRLASMAAWMPASGPRAGKAVGDRLDVEARRSAPGRLVATRTCGKSARKTRTVRATIGSPPTAANALSRPPMRDARPPARMTPATGACGWAHAGTPNSGADSTAQRRGRRAPLGASLRREPPEAWKQLGPRPSEMVRDARARNPALRSRRARLRACISRAGRKTGFLDLRPPSVEQVGVHVALIVLLLVVGGSAAHAQSLVARLNTTLPCPPGHRGGGRSGARCRCPRRLRACRTRSIPVTGNFQRDATTFGQVYLDRADPLGKGRVNVSVSYAYLELDELDGKPADDLRDPTPIPLPGKAAAIAFRASASTPPCTRCCSRSPTASRTISRRASRSRSMYSDLRVRAEPGRRGCPRGATSSRTCGRASTIRRTRSVRATSCCAPSTGFSSGARCNLAAGLLLRIPTGDEVDLQGIGFVELAPVAAGVDPHRRAGVVGAPAGPPQRGRRLRHRRRRRRARSAGASASTGVSPSR